MTGRQPVSRRTVGTGAARTPGRVGPPCEYRGSHPADRVPRAGSGGQTSCPLPPPVDTLTLAVIVSMTDTS